LLIFCSGKIVLTGKLTKQSFFVKKLNSKFASTRRQSSPRHLRWIYQHLPNLKEF
jgi:hypothetical protein